MGELFQTILVEEGTRRSSRLGACLTEANQIDAWLGIAASEELKKLLSDRRQVIALDLLGLLSEWQRLGGSIELKSNELSAPVAAPSPMPIASPELLELLRPEIRTSLIVPAPVREVAADWRPELAGIMSTLGLTGDDDADLERVYRGIRDSDRWKLLPRDLQRNLVGLMASRLRRLQDERGVVSIRIEESFSRLSAYSKREQPGYVIGLSRHHRPMRENWEEDSEAYWDRLSTWLPIVTPQASHEKLFTELDNQAKEIDRAPSLEIREAVLGQFRRTLREALKAGISSREPRLIQLAARATDQLEGPEFRSLRRSLRMAGLDERGEDMDEALPIPDDWRWWGRTQGRRALLVGGEPRELARNRLRDAFGFSELDWETSDFKKASLLPIRDRIRSGKVDVIVLIGVMVGHDADDMILAACRERGVDWVHVDKGPGSVRLKRAIERYLDPAPPEGIDERS
jgi:hypothetical protein